MPERKLTLRGLHQMAANRLRADPVLRDRAGRDAELLLLHALSLSRTTLLAYPERMVTPREEAALEAMLQRRLAHEPVQYITGEVEFFGLALAVTRETLIPRPETEGLVEAVLARLPRRAGLRVVDVGTGTGAIAIALAKQLGGDGLEPEVLAVDVSTGALAVARANALRHGARIEFRLSDLLGGVEGLFDAVVSNPPYIPAGDRATLHPEVRDWEPAGALFAGVDGLEIYRRLIPQAWGVLRPGGLLALEIGFGQEAAVRGMLVAWAGVEAIADLQGIARVVVAFRG